MPQIINTNIASLNAQRNLNTSQSSLATALQRLSSGLRINSAKDDAAGLAISERFTTQIRGLNQATRNANDGISLAQTGEGSLAEITQNLQRIRELAVQSANATNSSSDRAALDLEVQQRIAEIDRTAVQTSFNGQKILDGTFGSAVFQVGANVGETIGISLATSMRSSSIGAIVSQAGNNRTGNDMTADATNFGTTLLAADANKSTAGANTYASPATGTYAGVSSTAFDGNNFSINGTNIAASSNYMGTANSQDATSAYAKAAAINSSGPSGIYATATTELTFGTTGGTAGDTDFLAMWSQNDGTEPGLLNYTLNINGFNVLSYNEDFATSGNVQNSLAATTHGVSLTDAKTAINANSSQTGVVASIDTNGNLKLTATDGRNIQIKESILADIQNPHPQSAIVRTVFSELTETGWQADTVQNHTYRGQITLNGDNDLTLAGTTTAAGFASPVTLTANGSLNNASVTTVSNANNTIIRTDAALKIVSDLRSLFGAIQNRFESVITNLQTTAENLTASRSRIQDTDFAAETASLTRAQILQQSGIAMLSQANALPQNVLFLLQ
ncbi:MAG: B-type flagellin [Betaproteobacteria bacterium ADurb.Bin341]|nr:MAG: B-type flagellin [Betaproteobacteria bacterium ADurb.Bin341]